MKWFTGLIIAFLLQALIAGGALLTPAGPRTLAWAQEVAAQRSKHEPPPLKDRELPARADDPRIKVAQAEKELLDTQGKELEKAMQLDFEKSLTKALVDIEAMKPNDLTDERVAVGSFKHAVVQLRGIAKEVLAKQADYRRHLNEYHQELSRAPMAFRPAADVFEQMGKDESIPEFKDRYRKMAVSLRDLARVMETRAKELPAEDLEVSEAYRYVAAAERYLGALQEWLATYPEFQSGLERKKQIDELRKFIQYFKKLDSAFDRMHKRIVQQPQS